MADALPVESALRSLRSLMPTVMSAMSVASAVEELDPAEARCTGEMTLARRREFAAGRCAARRALRQAGHPRPVVVASHDGLPVFPEGYIGSISHKHGHAVAAVAASGALVGVGIDLEFDDPQAEADLQPIVVRKVEQPALLALSTAEPDLGSPSTLVLSAKEAVYKAVFPLRRTDFDFDDLHVAFEANLRAFRAVLFPGRRGLRVTGRYAINERWIVCIAIARHEDHSGV